MTTTFPTPPLTVSGDELAERGWKTERWVDADGNERLIQVPLTPEEFLHPEEGYHLPSNTFHDRVSSDLKDMLRRRYAAQPDVGVFGDLLIQWGIEGLGNHCPDVFVVFGLQDRDRQRESFQVLTEGVKPSLILEVVSPRYRKEDRQDKVWDYARAGVEEYIIFDRRWQRGIWIDEVLGYRLRQGLYLPLTPDEEGLILSEQTGLRMGLQEGRVLLVDAQTGEKIPTAQEWEAIALQERQRADQERQRADQERQRADQERERAERLAQRLQALGIDPDNP
ncbi:MAG: Uma2 family endonuclease [Thermostichus sp. DRC_bins_24]